MVVFFKAWCAQSAANAPVMDHTVFRREDLIEILECFAGADPETLGAQSVGAAAPVQEKKETLEVNT